MLLPRQRRSEITEPFLPFFAIRDHLLSSQFSYILFYQGKHWPPWGYSDKCHGPLIFMQVACDMTKNDLKVWFKRYSVYCTHSTLHTSYVTHIFLLSYDLQETSWMLLNRLLYVLLIYPDVFYILACLVKHHQLIAIGKASSVFGTNRMP